MTPGSDNVAAPGARYRDTAIPWARPQPRATKRPLVRAIGMGHTSVPEPAIAQPGAIAALFRDHHAELVRLALLMVGDLPTAEDVVQDVFASLHRRSRAHEVDAPLPYVRAAVLNGCRSVLRRRATARRAGMPH